MVSELEAGHQKAQLELSNQIEELKMKVRALNSVRVGLGGGED